MSKPQGFSWIDEPHLAAMALPEAKEELEWLRAHGIDVLISLTEDPLRRDWVNDAGILVVHEPVDDMAAPTQEQLDRCISSIDRALKQNMGVAVHCGAGLGRTGVVIAAYLVHQGQTNRDAIAQVRRLRPGSIETEEQAAAVAEFARRKRQE
jgi:atypical dual specificity phosphatase